MIPFAGKDPWENQFSGGRPLRRPKSLIAYERFTELGWDTQQIAEHMRIPESRALKFINIERSKLFGKPNPYTKESERE
jgi:hypothetical protein